MSSQTPSPDQSPPPARKRSKTARAADAKKSKTNPVTEADENESDGGGYLFSNAAPSWLFSLLMHVAIILVAAFFVLPRPISKSISFDGAPPSDSPVESVDISLDSFDEVSEDSASEMAASDAVEVTEPVEQITPEATVDVGAILASEDTTLDLESSQLESNAVTATGETNLRTGNGRGDAVRKYGGSAGSESAVKAALKWIVDHQLPDGGWDLNHQLGPGKRTSANPGSMEDTRNAATALALLPLLGDGQTHKTGEYKDAVFNGLKFLLEHGRGEGNGISFYERGGTMYSHGLVAIVLCEVYAMTEDPELAPFAQKSINYIEENQSKKDGGWGYGNNSKHRRPASDSDTSVVGWQLMALKSAIGSGLRVKPQTMKQTKKFLNSVSELKEGGYRYAPATSKRVGKGTTSIGALSSMYLGAEKDSNGIRKSIEKLEEWGPEIAPPKKGGLPVANMYYNYYATQAMKQYGGEKWKTWNVEMRDFLVKQQAREGPEAGSWMFDERFTQKAGRLYATSLACMTLEVYYRFLPLYNESILDDDFPL